MKKAEDTFVVYALYSEKFQKIYIGYSSNLIERMRSHNYLGKTGYTTKFRPWLVVYTEMISEKSIAMRREKSLKSASGRRFIWDLIKKSY